MSRSRPASLSSLVTASVLAGLLPACGGEDLRRQGEPPDRVGASASYVTQEAVPAPLRPPGLTVKGRQLYRNGKPFQVRGVNYSPIPIGSSFDSFYWLDNQLRGDGGDVFANSYYANLWEDDLAKMEAMGVNTIRLYAMHPWEPQVGPSLPRDHKAFLDLAEMHGIQVFVAFPISNGIFRYQLATSEPTDGSWFVRDGANIWVADETRQENGWQYLGPQTAAQRRASDLEAYEALAAEVGAHPAVAGFVISNELNSPQNRANPAFWAYLNQVAGRLHAIAPSKRTMVTLIDDSMRSLNLVKQNGWDVSNIDIWGINSYRGRLGDANQGFNDLFDTFAAASDKPFIVSEFGAPATTRSEIVAQLGVPIPQTGDPAGQGTTLNSLCASGTMALLPDRAALTADYVEAHWRDIDAHRDVAAGGIVFEWQDEYFKAGSHSGQTDTDIWAQSNSPAGSASFPGGCWDEEGFGLNGVTLTRAHGDWAGPVLQLDPRTPRAAFDRLQALWTK